MIDFPWLVHSLTDEHNLAKDLSDLIVKAQVPNIIEVENSLDIPHERVILTSCIEIFCVHSSVICMDVHEVRGQRSNIDFFDVGIVFVS